MTTPQERINLRSRRRARIKGTDEEDQHSGHRFYSSKLQATIVRIDQGNCYVTDKDDEVLTTVLGSCVSACIRDPIARIGGMNHFMLPVSSEGTWTAKSEIVAPHLRYGNFAMEQLINGIMKRGGVRDRLEVKVFGGGNVLRTSTSVGHNNADFVEQYLKDEGLKIAAMDLRGDYPRKLQFFPTEGRVRMLKMDNANTRRLQQEEAVRIAKPRVEEDEGGDIELWD